MRQSFAIAAVCLMLSGCAGMLDPYERDGTWKITGVNDDNLRQMLLDPLDMHRGSGATVADGFEAAPAVARLRTGTVKELPSSTLSEVGGSSGSGGAGNTGAGGAGASAGGN
jgi:hypothetical protein